MCISSINAFSKDDKKYVICPSCLTISEIKSENGIEKIIKPKEECGSLPALEDLKRFSKSDAIEMKSMLMKRKQDPYYGKRYVICPSCLTMSEVEKEDGIDKIFTKECSCLPALDKLQIFSRAEAVELQSKLKKERSENARLRRSPRPSPSYQNNQGFIGSACPHCGFKTNSANVNSGTRVTCQSCNNEFLIDHGRQAFDDNRRKEMLSVISSGILPIGPPLPVPSYNGRPSFSPPHPRRAVVYPTHEWSIQKNGNQVGQIRQEGNDTIITNQYGDERYRITQ